MTAPRPNVLLITLDQFRADALSCAGHPVVRTPNLDALAAEGVRFARHYAQAAPCAPGRAALYTGTYQMNNRVVANGTPLDHSLDNVARLALRAGYHPVVFGYTDVGADPREITDPDDPRLHNWEGVLPGFEELLNLDERHAPWMEWLRSLGHDLHDALMIAQIDEADAAQVPGHIGPAAQGDGLTDVGFVDLTAVMATHGALDSWLSRTRYFKGQAVHVRAFRCFFADYRRKVPPDTP